MYTKASKIKSILHFILRCWVFGIEIHKSKYWGMFQEIARQQKRQIDVDVCRHAMTFDLLAKKLPEFEEIGSVCIIGDGQMKFLSPAIGMKSFKKIICINLSEILINEVRLLQGWGAIGADQISLVETESEMNELMSDETKKILLVPAQVADIVKNQSINLFVNISSFQEMDVKLVNEYFNIIKSNKPNFYCSNRESKTLYGGEQLNYYDFDRGECEILLDEDCLWDKNITR